MKLDLPNVTNARDLAGMKTKYGVVKANKLLRAGVLNRLEQADIDTLRQCNLKRVIDLRTETEIANAPDVKMDGVEQLNVSIVRAVTFGISFEALDGPTLAVRLQAGWDRMAQKGENYHDHMETIYRRYVHDEHCRAGYGRFLKTMANSPVDGATLWHCTMGKDRCGTCALLLEYCLGADKETMYEDFVESNVQTRENTNSLLNKVKPYVSPDKMGIVEEMLVVQPYYLDAFFDEIAKLYGSLDGFIKACGVTQEETEKLRENYLQ